MRTNDVIFAASKHVKTRFETENMRDDLERIIDSIFKVAFLNRKKHLYLWPIGCGVFKNNSRIVAEIFAKTIRKHMVHFREIVMVIYNREGNDKRFNDSFIDELNANRLNYRIN